MYGAIRTDDTTTNGLYVIQFLSDAYTLQNNTTIDVQVISCMEKIYCALTTNSPAEITRP